MTDHLGSDDRSFVRPTIPIAYLVEIAGRCRAHREEVAAALAAAALPANALASRRLRISIAQFERFHTALSRALDDELFGYFARPVPRGAYATLVRLLTGSTDVAAMVESAERFYRLFDRHRYVRFRVAGTLATLELAPRDREQARSIFFVHSMLLSTWRTIAWLVAQPVPLHGVTLPARFRAFRRESGYLFGREPTFANAHPSVTFSAAHAQLPSRRRAAEADRHAAHSLRDMLLAPPLPTLHTALRAVLAAATPFASLSLEQAARRLGRSRAALARELARHQTSFQALKDELRRDHAIALLTETSAGLAEIADRLGYSAASAFQRAFRDWTGVAPGALRRRPIL